MTSSKPGDFKRGDRVTVVHDTTRFETAIGRTGTVCSVSNDGGMVCVRDLAPRIKGAPRERTFLWNQLVKAERPNGSGEEVKK